MNIREEFDNYSDYFNTKWWFDLKYKHIIGNKNAKCFVCGRTDSLLLHHVNYQALYREKLLKDVYILCFDCHNRVHFWFNGLIKVSLSTNVLLFSMRLRKSTFCIRNRYFIMAVVWLLIALTFGVVFLFVFLIKKTIAYQLKLILKYS